MHTSARRKPRLRTRDLVYPALFAVLIAVCAWISVPSVVPFTMQTFAVFCTLSLLGGKRGLVAIVVYLALGAVGLPVFSGFNGGLGALLGTTGGYLLGFVFQVLIYWLLTALLGDRPWVRVAALVLGLLACYAFGTAWYLLVYARQSEALALGVALSRCVVPFIVPDLLKLALALLFSRRLRPHLG